MMGNLMKARKERIKYTRAPESQYEQAGGSYLTNLLSRPYQGYTGQRVAGMTPTEQRGQDILSGYVDRTAQPLQGLAESELTKTLTGEYDPSTSDYYKAMREGMGRETAGQVSAIRRTGQLGGGLYGTPTAGVEATARTTMANQLAQLLGGMAETERGRRLGAVPTAMQVAQYGEEAPLRSMQAIGQYGALPRELEQKGLEADYESYLREQDYPMQLAQLAQILLGKESTMMPKYQYGSSPFQDIMSAAGNILPFYLFRGGGATTPTTPPGK